MADFIIDDYGYTIIDDVNKYVNAKVDDTTKVVYQDIPDTVTNSGTTYTITSLDYCFDGCTNLLHSPSIPEHVVSMNYTFRRTPVTGIINVYNSPTSYIDIFDFNPDAEIEIIDHNEIPSESWQQIVKYYDPGVIYSIYSTIDACATKSSVAVGRKVLSSDNNNTTSFHWDTYLNKNTYINEDSTLKSLINSLEWDDVLDYSRPNEKYFYIEADNSQVSSFSFYITKSSGADMSLFENYVEPTFEYSYDTETWQSYTLNSYLSVGGNNPYNRVYFRGDNLYPWYDNYLLNNTRYSIRISLTSNNSLKTGGNVMSLRYSNPIGNEPIPCDYAFAYLFYGNSYVKTAPKLPATKLTSHCYFYMFGNSGITTLPKLPARDLAEYCYAYMFYGCTSLVKAEEILATEISPNSHKYMFSGCTSLLKAPKLYANTLSDYCYEGMFLNCSSLIKPPILSATNLAPGCYYNMFKGCSSLTYAPTLPATTLSTSCYHYMFHSCTSLLTPPKLPATTLAINCYSNMFQGCTSLLSIPKLETTTLYTTCYRNMFKESNVKASSINISPCVYEYRVPLGTSTGTTASSALSDMFTSSDGTSTYTPTINTTFYISVPVQE